MLSDAIRYIDLEDLETVPDIVEYVAPSPYRLTALIIGGGLLAAAGFLGGNVFPAHRAAPLLIAFLLLVVIGLLSMYWAAYTLRESVANERWSPETLARFRRVIDHPAWTWTMGLLLVTMVAALVATRHNRSYFWGIFCLIQVQTQIGNGFARPRKSNDASARLDWSQAAPLRSEHWGER